MARRFEISATMEMSVNTSLDSVVLSYSLICRRSHVSQARVRSTTQRYGRITPKESLAIDLVLYLKYIRHWNKQEILMTKPNTCQFVPLMSLQVQYHTIQDEISDKIHSVLDSSCFEGGNLYLISSLPLRLHTQPHIYVAVNF